MKIKPIEPMTKTESDMMDQAMKKGAADLYRWKHQMDIMVMSRFAELLEEQEKL